MRWQSEPFTNTSQWSSFVNALIAILGSLYIPQGNHDVAFLPLDNPRLINNAPQHLNEDNLIIASAAMPNDDNSLEMNDFHLRDHNGIPEIRVQDTAFAPDSQHPIR